jgi:hypothetical protein
MTGTVPKIYGFPETASEAYESPAKLFAKIRTLYVPVYINPVMRRGFATEFAFIYGPEFNE